ncbi:helix-turn-helix transcriptional regulator [Modestobacter versicolor]|uniref:helix-turn-helix transcriptional regulator n=1 Tax=Modestobacter versicolor TaxID=429133 RepID=UPI0034DE82C3
MTTGELYAADAEALVHVLEDARQDEPGPGLPWALLEGLLHLVPCDVEVSYQHHQYSACRTLLLQGVQPGGARCGPFGTAADPDDPFWRYWWHGPCSWPQRSGDLRRVTLVRDFFPTERDWLADPMSEVLGPEVRECMLVSLPAAPGEARRICFMRGRGSTFSERERQLAMLVRPHLQEIWLDAERRRSGVPQLTAREWEVLALAADGMPYAAIAGQLSISVGTVRKHMEHVRERLGVHSIAAAAALAMPHAPAHLPVRSTAAAPPASRSPGPAAGR